MLSPAQLIILLLVVVLIFGTKKLRNAGGDLGAAIRSFRKGLQEGEEPDKTPAIDSDEPPAAKADAPAPEATKTRQSSDADG